MKYLWNFFPLYYFLILGRYPGSSVGKESTCNAEDPDSMSGSGTLNGDGIGYPGYAQTFQADHPWKVTVTEK